MSSLHDAFFFPSLDHKEMDTLVRYSLKYTHVYFLSSIIKSIILVALLTIGLLFLHIVANQLLQIVVFVDENLFSVSVAVSS